MSPTNVFVAGFIGSPAMNLLEGLVSESVDFLQLGSQRIALPSSVVLSHPNLKAYAGRKVVVGIRPEDLPAHSPDGSEAVLTGDVKLVEALGSEILVHFKIDAKSIFAADSS
jgi:multiple sugar transport system ATP-binding protein